MSSSEQWECDKCTFINEGHDLTCQMCYQVRSSTRSLPYTWQWLAEVDWIPFDADSNEQLEAAYQARKSEVSLDRGWFRDKRGAYTVYFTYKSQHSSDAAAADGVGASSTHSPSPSNSNTASFVQVNRRSGMRRRVRRIATDEESLFVLIPPSSCQRGQSCSICCNEWWPEPEPEEQEPEQHESQQTNKDENAAAQTPSDSNGAAPSTVSSSSAGVAPASSTPPASAPSPATVTDAASATDTATCLTFHPSDTWPDVADACVKLAKCKPGHVFHRQCIAQWIKLKDHCPYCHTRI